MTSAPTGQTTTIKSEEKKKKAVFRQLLDSPFNLTWCKDTFCHANRRKSVDQQTSNDILNVLCSLLAPLAGHIPKDVSRKRKRQRTNPNVEKPIISRDHQAALSSVTIGFNATTEHLESEIQNASKRRLRAVFVTRGDTSSSHLYAHFPMMASMLPSLRLVSLAKGAEARLCDVLRVQRVGVIGVMDDAPGADALFQLVEEKVPNIECPWKTEEGEISFVPTRIKWIKTLSNNKPAKEKPDKSKDDSKAAKDNGVHRK